MGGGLKLNLGCGQNVLVGYVNVDKFGSPDLKCDLEQFPWPWKDSSVDEVILNHVLEHLGASPDVFLRIMQELYRVCAADARIKIQVPHPRHDDYLTDPTHVRPITEATFSLFSKTKNREWATKGISNSPLGLFLDVDFETEKISYDIDEPWHSQANRGELSWDDLVVAMKMYNNVTKAVHVDLRVVK